MRVLIAAFLLTVCMLATAQGNDPLVDQGRHIDRAEWVVVFNDPRPPRLQDWTRSSYGAKSNYKGSLELERFGKKVATKYDMELRDQWLIPSLGVYCLVVRFNSDQAETIDNLKKDKAVQLVQPSNEFELLNADHPIKPEEVSNISLTLPSQINGAGVVIAIIDSAVDDSHQDLIGAVSKTDDFVVAGNEASMGESHGTAIAGVVITQKTTKLGVTGVAPAATLHAYRGCWESAKNDKTNCNTLSLARALDAVLRSEADILNLSLSGPEDALLDLMLQRLLDRGTMVVAAFDPARPNSSRFPTQRKGVLIVRAKGLDDRHTTVFSAPGARVVPRPGNRYDFMHGHSVATAYTTGLLALRKQALDANPSTTKDDTDWRNTSRSTMAEDLLREILRES